MFNVTSNLLKFKQYVNKNIAHVYTGFTIGGIIFTGYTAYKSGLKAYEINKKYKEDLEICKDDLTKKTVKLEYAKDMALTLASPTILGGLSIASAIMADREFSKNIAILTTAYAVTDKALREKDQKITEIFGKQKAQKVNESIAKDDILKNPPPNNIHYTNYGVTLCKDLWSGRYFYSSAEHIGFCINKLSAECMNSMYASLNEFYDYIGIPGIEMGDEFCWRAEDLISGNIPITYSAQLTDSDKPCLCIHFVKYPRLRGNYISS